MLLHQKLMSKCQLTTRVVVKLKHAKIRYLHGCNNHEKRYRYYIKMIPVSSIVFSPIRSIQDVVLTPSFSVYA